MEIEMKYPYLIRQNEDLLKEVEAKLPDWAPLDKAILVGLRGSDAHGTKLDKGPDDLDDVDVFVVAVQDAHFYFGLNGYHNKKRQHYDSAGDELDILVYDVRKFMDLAANCNPNVINWLFNRPEDYLLIKPQGEMLLKYKHYFLSKEIFPRLVGYSKSQIDRMNADKAYQGYMGDKRKKLVDEYGYDLKNAGHAIRLLMTGIEIAETNTFCSYMGEERAELIKDIKRGRYSLQEVTDMFEEMLDDFRMKEILCTLPDKSDRLIIDGFLVRIIRTFNGEYGPALV